VIEIGGFGRRRTVTVEFQKDERQETFVAEKCPLQPVNSP
jgi:DNA helicase-2/ATP-dependent DNA helicase PcrA